MGLGYLRGYYDPHRGLRTWSNIARLLPELTILRVPMHTPEKFRCLVKYAPTAFFFKLLGHFGLIGRIFRVPNNTILIREFLTVPLLLIAPFLFWQRHRLWFMCQHNIAFAHSKPSHRIVLRLLRHIGFRFVVFEDANAWKVIEPDVGTLDLVRSIPLPFQTELNKADRRKERSTLTVGFVGNFRKEKSPMWALDILAKACVSNESLYSCELLVGTPDPEFRDLCAHHGRVVDTGSYSSYLDALFSCDVVVLPYDPSSYAYRSSGVLAEAVACGCAVVVPDVPTLRDQVFYPSPVGACYADQEGLIGAVQSAVALVRSGKLEAALKDHYSARGPIGTYAALLGLTK
jgi:glycosyltransferase involved in cell wall biosynthesis